MVKTTWSGFAQLVRPGRKPVQVFADAALNQVVFMSGSVLATVPANPATMPVEELEQRVKLLLGASKFAPNGILSDKIQIGDGSIETPIRFMGKLKQYNRAVELSSRSRRHLHSWASESEPGGGCKRRVMAPRVLVERQEAQKLHHHSSLSP